MMCACLPVCKLLSCKINILYKAEFDSEKSEQDPSDSAQTEWWRQSKLTWKTTDVAVFYVLVNHKHINTER